MADNLTKHLNDENYIVHHLSMTSQPRLSAFDEFIAFLSTPFKRLGISGWTKTSCSAGGVGQIKQIGLSTDGFITIDVWITNISVSCNHGTTVGTTTSVNNKRYIRLEVEPDTEPHEYFRRTPFKESETIFFQGPILIDRDGDGFYEVHPSRIWHSAVRPTAP
jgi:hypothetical protein